MPFHYNQFQNSRIRDFSIRAYFSVGFFNQWASKTDFSEMESKILICGKENKIDKSMKLFYINYKSNILKPCFQT